MEYWSIITLLILHIQGRFNMRKFFVLLFFLVTVLVGCRQLPVGDVPNFTEKDLPSIDPIEIKGTLFKKTLKVVGLGDSLTEGVGDERQISGYFGRLTAEMENWAGVSDVQAVNAAKKGRRSDQLLNQLDHQAIQEELKRSDIILMTIGGNDVMKIIKRDLFKLRTEPFYDELKGYEERLEQIFTKIRSVNEEAVIIIGSLYNPFTVVADEETELDHIIESWNEVIEQQVVADGQSCYIQVQDLFHSNDNLVYHTDFFHPNAKGYEQMTNRYIEIINKCNLKKLTNGNFDV